MEYSLTIKLDDKKQATLEIPESLLKKYSMDEIARRVIKDNINEAKQVITLSDSINAGRCVHDIRLYRSNLSHWLKHNNFFGRIFKHVLL